MWDNQHQAAAQRYAERRQQEDAAPRLTTQVPALKSLCLAIEERSGTWTSPDPGGSHVRHIVVSTAPALFLITCHDPVCREGGHDVTPSVMRALRAGQASFAGEDRCRGQVGSADCQRSIRYVGSATYWTNPSENNRP
jgi:hypothetical protein